MPLKHYLQQTTVSVSPGNPKKIRLVETSPQRGFQASSVSTPPPDPSLYAPHVDEFREMLSGLPNFSSMLMVVGNNSGAATVKLERFPDQQTDAQMRMFNQAHYIFREVATKVFRMMGVQMTLLHAREQHDEARKSLLQFLIAHQPDLGQMFSGITSSSLLSALTELRKIGKRANSSIHSVTLRDVFWGISVFRTYHMNPEKPRVELPPPSQHCLGVLMAILKQVLGITTDQELIQNYNMDDRDLGDILASYCEGSKLENSEPLKSIKLDWVRAWDSQHWGKVVAIGETQGFCIPTEEHLKELKDSERRVQHAKDDLGVSEKENLATQAKNRTLQTEVKSLKKRVKRLEEQNLKLDSEIATIKAEFAAVKLECATVKAENAKLNQKIQDIEDGLNTMMIYVAAQFADMQRQIDNLTSAANPLALPGV
ncbi:hypothetical protein L211DRAFT_871567 [Terfezia boudieri ATCC MYA-4762]|uniref:Uncharacterized protein n=1 Tax=Terfezia boudieri ATCC MYA-4762 TaxID=1051890 RepID=A0A3N4L8G8_9PEZI|nr:hypothetical protein L211DRAFT_871567 [Terfezia boudieri ATCC MYA-4762]